MLKLFTKSNMEKLVRNPRRMVAKGMHKATTEFSAAFLDGYSPFPENLTFFLTYRCNLRCNVCGQWGRTGYVKNFPAEQLRDEVDIVTLKKRIDELHPHRPQITMCGGETLLYSGWYDFMSHVKSRGLECILTTNGTMLEEAAEKLVDIGLDKISLSLDGPEEVHNRARGSDAVFQKATRGIRLINELKEKRNALRPLVEIGCTISDQNYRHLDDVIHIAESMNVSCLIFLHLFFIDDAVYERQSRLFRELFKTDSIHWSGYRYRPEGLDLEYLAGKLDEIKSKRYGIPVVVHPDFSREEINSYYTSSAFLSTSYSNTCLAPWTSVYVLPNGDISPCSSFVAGNIREKSFAEIWNNEEFRRFRRELRQRKFFPVCPKCCEFYKY
jgi:MoaA/NifB/PqqE/SkfB family radical SAM enzyme